MEAIVLIPARMYNRPHRGELHIVDGGRGSSLAPLLQLDMPEQGRHGTVEVMPIHAPDVTVPQIERMFQQLGFFICRCDGPASYHRK